MDSPSSRSSYTIEPPRFPMSFLLPLDINPISISATMDEEQLRAVHDLSVVDPKIEDSTFFDLRPPPPKPKSGSLEEIMQRLFSEEHLLHILRDHALFHRFSVFVNKFKPQSAPTLVRYLELQKAMKAIEYANAVAGEIRWPTHADHHKFSRVAAATTDSRLAEYSSRELQLLRTEVLPAFISQSLVNFVVDCVTRDITGQAIPGTNDLVGNLAEVFCLTDPSMPDNPIIYASEEFHKTTQYGTSYAIDRNCRFLQGPGTDENCTSRLAAAISKGEEACETILNYRRDGSPFINLLMCAPLYDDKGVVRYFIGAQVDVSGLILEGRGIESFRALLQSEHYPPTTSLNRSSSPDIKSPTVYSPTTTSDSTRRKAAVGSAEGPRTHESLTRLGELSLFFSLDEVDSVTRHSRSNDLSVNAESGTIPTPPGSTDDMSTISEGRGPGTTARGQGKRIIGAETIVRRSETPQAVVQRQPSMDNIISTAGLPGVYKHYILAQPYPTMRILFVSPSLRIPGLLRTPLFTRLGGSAETLSALAEAFSDGASVTAKISWLPKISSNPVADSDQGRPRWIRCTPLLGSDDKVGVWMIILVSEEGDHQPPSYGHRQTRETDFFSELVKSDRLQDSQRAMLRAHSQTVSTKSSMQVYGKGEQNQHGRLENDHGHGFGSGIRRLTKLKLGASRTDKEKGHDLDMYADYMRSL